MYAEYSGTQRDRRDSASHTRTTHKPNGLQEWLIGEELTKLSTRVQQLNDMAREPTLVSGSRATGDSIGYRGLTSPERDELHKIADYLVNIRAVCEEGRRIAMRLGNNGEKWDRLLAECADACDTAQRAYDARY